MAATYMTIAQACGCPLQGTFDLSNRDDIAFLAHRQKKRCVAHHRLSPVREDYGRQEGNDDEDCLNFRGY